MINKPLGMSELNLTPRCHDRRVRIRPWHYRITPTTGVMGGPPKAPDDETKDPQPAQVTRGLRQLTVAELRKEARSRGLRGTSRLKRHALLQRLLEHGR